MQRSDAELHDLSAPVDVGVNDVKVLKIKDLVQVERILALYNAVQVEKMPFAIFRHHFMERRDAWFLEVGDKGIIYFTNIVPNQSAELNVMFWDKKLGASRVEVIKSAVMTAFTLFNLDRMSAFIPWRVAPMRRVLRDAGFQLEGTIRRGWLGPPVDDLTCLGMLKEEQPCLAVPLPAISLE